MPETQVPSLISHTTWYLLQSQPVCLTSRPNSRKQHAETVLSDSTPSNKRGCKCSVLTHAGLRWAIPRMQQLQTLQILLTTAEALDVMATAAGQCNFCSLTRLDFCCHRYSPASTSREQGARALQAILHQVSALF